MTGGPAPRKLALDSQLSTLNTARMRLGIFGGTFDPVHYGHLRPVDEAAAMLALDRVVYVPARRSPWKKERVLADERHRVAMLALALAGRPDRMVSLLELQRPEPSYTVDTLRLLRQEDPGAELFFLLGSDLLAGFTRWKEPDMIIGLCTLVVFRREPHPVASAGGDLPAEWRRRLVVLETEPVKISATALRRAVRDGEDIAKQVPDAVLEYITKERLYLPEATRS